MPSKVVIGIPRETVNPWERRVVLTPEHVDTLVRRGVHVIVQPSNKRIFTCEEYLAVGAEINEDLGKASVIFGVKRPTDTTIRDLMPNKTYAFFTHTIKAQKDNMAMLDILLERNIRMFDYECMVDEKNRRLCAFGKFAGLSGMITILHGLGQRLLVLGYSTPFMVSAFTISTEDFAYHNQEANKRLILHAARYAYLDIDERDSVRAKTVHSKFEIKNVALPQNYSSLELARQSIKLVGYEIAIKKMPKSLGPLIFLFTGLGNVSKGAQSIFRHLPHEYISPSVLKHTAINGRTDIVYACVISDKDHIRHKITGSFDRADFLANPQNYKSVFGKEIAPYISVLINGIYWGVNHPRLLTLDDCKMLVNNCKTSSDRPVSNGVVEIPMRLLAICDISADPDGSLEFMQECTTIERPFEIYNPATNKTTEGIIGDGFLVCSIDNMPTQIPRESSMFFGDSLMSFIDDMCTITSNGKLTPRFQYIAELRKQKEGTEKHVLILGAGYVALPIVGYLIRDSEIRVTVISNHASDLVIIKNYYPSVSTKHFDVFLDSAILSKLISEHDLVMSMVPWNLHPQVLSLCIKHKKNMLTASYCSPTVRDFEKEIQEAGIIAFMEIGLDPGIDHLLSMKCIDETHAKGGKVISYTSYTGGLPAPEYADNSLRYKFSWSPEAAMSTVLNGAIYLENSRTKEIPSGGQLMDAAHPINDLIGFNLEGYPNRDSIAYKQIYGLKDCETVIRGTLRYKGFAKVMRALIDLGFMSQIVNPKLEDSSQPLTWKEVTCVVTGIDKKLTVPQIETAIKNKLNTSEEIIRDILNLGLLSDKIAELKRTPFSTLTAHLVNSLAYGPKERDLILMSHHFTVEWPDKRRELKTLRLVMYGEEGKGNAGFAMSRTVGLTAAIAGRMVLKGEVRRTGIVLPFTADLYEPILERLEKEGIAATEMTTPM